jgi:hypothetical protein
MSLNEVLERGQRVRLLSGEKGITIGENENFEFPLWEIKLENGKIKDCKIRSIWISNYSILE